MFHRGYSKLAMTSALFLFSFVASAEKAQLTLKMADHATGYMEWVLDTQFTAEQRQHYQQMLVKMWRAGKGSEQGIAAMAKAHENLPQIEEGERNRLRAAKQPEFVKFLESNTDDDSRWLLGLYRAAHQGAPAQPSAVTASLLGKWSDSHVSSIQYKNAYTGVSAPTNGNSFSYEFQPDGTYSFTGLLQSTMYNCTSATFSHETGTYQVEGDTVSLHPEKNPYKMTNNCAPSSNREAPGKLIAKSYRFRVLSENDRKYLELRGSEGSAQKFAESR